MVKFQDTIEKIVFKSLNDQERQVKTSTGTAFLPKHSYINRDIVFLQIFNDY